MQNGRNMGPGNVIAPTSHGRPLQNARMPYPPRTLPPPPLRQKLPTSTPPQQGQTQPQHNRFRALNRPPPLPKNQDDMPAGGEFTMPVNPTGTGNNYIQTAADKQSGRVMLLASLAFLIFYILIVSSKLLNDHNVNKRLDLTEHKSHVSRASNQISSSIKYIGVWINNGISEGKTASQSARMIAMSPMVKDVAILNAQNKIIAQSSESANFLTQVSFNKLANDTFKITSIITPNGQTTPVIIKKTGNYYLVAALSKMALINAGNTQGSPDKLALIASSGRVIYGQAELGKVGPRDWFNLSGSEFEKITNSDSAFFDKIKIHGIKYRLISAQIPNSDLKFLEARPQTDTAALTGSLILFATLFLGTCLLVGMLLNSLHKQLVAARTIHRQTEVSQQRYQAAIEGDRGGIWELDIPENSAYLSASLAGLLGMPRQEHHMTISEFLNLFHPRERDKFLSVARRAHIQGEFEIDVNIAHLPLVLQCRGRPSTRSENSFKRVIVGVALDITEQRRSQAKLRSTESQLHNALSSMTDSFVVWDSHNRLVMWNLRFEEFFRLGQGALQVGAEHASVEYMARAAIAESFTSTENPDLLDIKLKDGRWVRYVQTNTVEGGRVSVGTDITEIRLRESELRENSAALKNTVDVLRKSQDRIFELAEGYEQEKIRAEEANQSKTDFLASMSHELRTPLNAINGFSDIMKKEMFGPLGDPRYKEYIGDILFSGQHLLTLINDILDMSKIEAGKMSLNTEIIFMHEMIAQVGRIIRGRAEEAQLNLDITTQDVHEIEADPRAVKQILINLLTNAIKFTPEGGTVRVELIEKKTGLIIKIHDSGIGISPENVDRLAKPFEQVIDNENKHKEGTGLGLALSKSLIELHGGNFKIESVVGEGTTVIFSMPNTPVEQAEETETQDMRQEITRLAEDIAAVLETDDKRVITANEADTLLNTNPYPSASSPYTEPQRPQEPISERPAA